ncbi:PBECR4 domain-containing protein [Streptococcus mutans]|uniref:PBECR4 domain-containing protein n=1 Tax=Streptococcus mutans TaxID=1309 RepID=UPI0028EEAF92|nr:PBECR4 domain-containing protein [Streptococcus mutans]MDT9519938.1 PBECR4 domain-containing protein [Streptococcus mutans]MDT9558040.1 PBECR4 domain-containing protein [Streptococcus mutans]MDT9601136.1 PBECR4 domain-containing protein [Streptococcus mutans]
MAEEHTQQPSLRGKSRRERVEYARSRDILDVANELNMELVRSGRDYRWKEHDSMVISPDKNMWNWFSRHQGGDVISLVETMKEVNFNQAIDYLNDGSFKEYKAVERVQEPFSYYLEPYEQPFEAARSYLKDQRGLSNETIDFFLDKGVLAQANAKVNGSIEPVVVFKSFDFSGEIVGATLQGIEENWEKWPERGYAKNIVRNSDGIIGLHVDIGQPNRLIFAESAIDLMSYYELHKDTLQDVRLISMDGVKEAVVGRHLAQLQSDISGRPLRWSHDQLAEGLQTAIDNNFFADGKHADWITLAVDNDTGGRNFIDSLREKGAIINEDLPDLQPGQTKTDWNDALKNPPNEFTDAIDEPSVTADQSSRINFLNQLNQNSAVTSVRPVTVLKQDELYSDYWHAYQSDGNLEFYLSEDGQFGYRQYGSLSPKEDNIIFKFHSEAGTTDFLATQMGYDNLRYIVNKDWESLFDSDKELLRENYVFKDLDNFLQNSDAFELDYWTFDEGLKQAQKVARQDEEFLDELTKKAPDQNQELPNNTGGELFNRSSSFLGDESPRTAPQPVEQIAQPDFPTNVPLYFNIDKDIKSNFRLRKGYYYPKKKDIRNINAYAADIQKSANWYLNELANTTVTYFYKDGLKQQALQVNFEKRHWMHLTGMAPVYSEKLDSVSETFIDEVSSGRTNFQNVTVGPGYLDKIQILPMLSEVLETDSFVFDDLSSIEKLGRLDAEAAIRSEDKNVILAFQTDSQDEMFPASLLKPGLDLNIQMDTLSQEKTILGVLIEKDDEIRVHRINTDYIKDNGAEMVEFLNSQKNDQVRDVTPGNTVDVYRQDNDQDILPSREDPSELVLAQVRFHDHLELETSPENGIVSTLQSVELVNLVKESDVPNIQLYSDIGKNVMVYEGLVKFDNRVLDSYDFTNDLDRDRFVANELTFDRDMVAIVDYEQQYRSEYLNVEKLSEITPEAFTQVLDAVYNVGAPQDLSNIPEEFLPAWNHYFELSKASQGNFKQVIDKAAEANLLLTDSSFYKEWNQDRIHNENYHVRLQRAETWPDGPQVPFNDSDLIDYQEFAEELYKQNKAFYRHQGPAINETETQEAYIPFTKVKFDVYAPGGTLIKSDVRYDVGDETEPISRLLGLGYRRLEGQPELAAIDEKVLSQLENQEVNRDIATEANEQTVVSQEIPQEGDSRENFQSPKQDIKTGLAQRVEEIMAEDATKILVSSIPQVQENLSMEGDLIGTPQSDGQMLYTNQEDFGRDYQLELAVHSPVQIDQLSDIQAPWTLALIQGEQKLGYLAYGGDWGNDFQVKKELEKLASRIGVGNSPEGLYKQEEIDAFLTNNGGQKPDQRTQENLSSAEPFDYKMASAYDVSERAFQKIREYTQSPEDLMEYMEFMSKFPQLSPRNVALIQDQWRGANAVATYDQWKSMGEALGIKPEDVIQTKATYVNKRTGETKEVIHQGLSVKTGEKSQITLFRPLMVRMIPVIDENGNHIKNDKGNPKYKKFSDATPQEKELVKEGKLPVRQFQERDPKTGQPRFTTYKVFELSQTTLKPESYPKAMPNRHYNFNTDKVKTKEVLEGLCDYAESIGVSIMKDEAHVLGNAKGAFFPEEQLILINPDNTSGEKIATTIHELAHATLHNPSLADQYKELPKVQKELEAEMTSHLLAKHFGLDTSEKAIDYMAKWTNNLQGLNDKQLTDSLKRIHKTVSKMHKQIEHHTKPYQLGKNRGQNPNFSKAPTKGPSR